MPCSIRTLISSSVTGCSLDSRSPKSLSNPLVEPSSSFTSGDVSADSLFIGAATIEAILSGLRSANRFGINSPMTRER